MDNGVMDQQTVQLGWIVLYVDDVTRSVAFAETAFGLSRRFMTEEADYAEMETGATALAYCARSVGSATTGLSLASGDPHMNVTLVVLDVQVAFDRAVTAGASPVLAPTVKPWGQTTSFVRDLDGHLIELATVVSP
jgi:lactoylglutathione lyase